MSGRRESNPLLRTGGTPSGSEGLCAAITPLPQKRKTTGEAVFNRLYIK